jgi:pimeloyl-ACP methyl ester carboxylesterase
MTFVATLPIGHRVITFDHRGTGDSDKPERPEYTTRGFAQDVITILDALSIARTHVYGASMGGRVAQMLAIDHPQRVGALVFGCITPGMPDLSSLPKIIAELE